MTEQEQIAKQAEQAVPLTAEDEPSEVGVNQKPGAGKVAATSALLLAILITIAFSVAGWWLWPQWLVVQQRIAEQQHSQQQLSEQLVQLTLQRNAQQQQQLERLEQQMLSWQRASQQDVANLSEQFNNQLAKLQQQLAATEGAPPQHWVLAEVAFLLKRASLSLMVQPDLPSARLLLQQADARLQRLDNPALLNVRQAILADLQALQQVSLPDYSKVYLLLAQLRQQSLQLPLKQQEQPLLLPAAADAEWANWRQNIAVYWQQSWRKLFHVRPAEPQDLINLSVEQQLQLRLTLQQQLLLAELALLQGEQQGFSRAIQQGADLLQRYFAANSAMVQRAGSELVELSHLALQPAVIPVLQSPAQLERQLSLLAKEGI